MNVQELIELWKYEVFRTLQEQKPLVNAFYEIWQLDDQHSGMLKKRHAMSEHTSSLARIAIMTEIWLKAIMSEFEWISANAIWREDTKAKANLRVNGLGNNLKMLIKFDASWIESKIQEFAADVIEAKS